MRHQKSGRKLGRTSSHRDAMFKNMTTSLLMHDRIRTTNAKAKELRKYAERMITLARKVRNIGDGGGDKDQLAKALHYRRQALQYVVLPGIDANSPDQRAGRKEILDKLFVDLADRFANRNGGYTRVLKIGVRRGDGAPMSIIEFVGDLEKKEGKSSKKKSKKKKTAKEKPEQVKTEVAPVEQEAVQEEAKPEETPQETEAEETPVEVTEETTKGEADDDAQEENEKEESNK